MNFRRALALAALGLLTASCSAAPQTTSATSPSTLPSASSAVTPAGPVANASCPGANSQISTDRSLEALRIAQTAWSAERALQSFLDQYKIKVVVLPFIGSQ